MFRRPPDCTLYDTLCPYTSVFRSFFLIGCETATIFSMDSSLSARAVALAAEQARPEAGAGAGLRDSALIGEGEPLGLLPPSVPFFTQFGNLLPQQPVFSL